MGERVLRRYRALQRRREGGKTYDLVRKVFLPVFPVTVELLDRVRALLDEYPGLMPATPSTPP